MCIRDRHNTVWEISRRSEVLHLNQCINFSFNPSTFLRILICYSGTICYTVPIFQIIHSTFEPIEQVWHRSQWTRKCQFFNKHNSPALLNGTLTMGRFEIFQNTSSYFKSTIASNSSLIDTVSSWCVMIVGTCRTQILDNTRSPYILSLIHIWRCRRSTLCRSRWSPYH